MTVGEFKAKFSDVIAQVKAEQEIAVTFGRKKEIIGYFTLHRRGKLEGWKNAFWVFDPYF